MTATVAAFVCWLVATSATDTSAQIVQCGSGQAVTQAVTMYQAALKAKPPVKGAFPIVVIANTQPQ